jgi:hypothetical protein
LACFLSPKPSDPEGDGDSAEFFEKAADAITRAQTLLNAGRFKYLVLWDGGAGAWNRVEEFEPSPN